MILDYRRRAKLRNGKMRVVEKNIEALETQFADKSYAITREGHFVPIIPRHMSTDNWRELFWLQPKKLVIYGERYRSLCSVCLAALSCLPNKEQHQFECQVTAKMLTVNLKRRRR